MNLEEFLAQISGAHYVELSDDRTTFFEWDGSQTVNVWTLSRGGAGQFTFADNSDVFMGTFAEDALDEGIDVVDVVRDSIKRYEAGM